MKNIYILLLLVLTAFTIHAQIPNADFENWTAAASYDDPDNWGTLNSALVAQSIVTVTKSTNASHGTFAAQLTAHSLIVGAVPGIIGSNAMMNHTSFSIHGGFPCTTKYSKFTGYYSCNPQGGDTVAVIAVLTKWNSSLGKKDTIAMATVADASVQTNAIHFNVPFVYFSNATPDSALIVGSTSTNLYAAHPNSTITIDSLNFSGLYNEVHDIKNSVDVKLYPNPATSTLHLYVPEVYHSEFIITDFVGRIIQTEILNDSQTDINLQSLSVGSFGYLLKDDHGAIISSGKFSVQR